MLDEKSIADIRNDLATRQAHSIPPGYKDASKPDSGIGDLLIWRTILDVGEKLNVDVIFVSSDEKADWWHQSDKQALYPRHELVDEFRRHSKGKSLHILRFSDFLRLFGASKEVVEEVRQEEKQAVSVTITQDRERTLSSINSAVTQWLMLAYSGAKIEEGFEGLKYNVTTPRKKRIAVDWRVNTIGEPSRTPIINAINRLRAYSESHRQIDLSLLFLVTLDETAARQTAQIIDSLPLHFTGLAVVVAVLTYDGALNQIKKFGDWDIDYEIPF